MPSSAPPVTVRLALSMPSAASWPAARRRSRGETGASAYIRADRLAGWAGSSGSRSGSGPPVIRSLVPAGALRYTRELTGGAPRMRVPARPVPVVRPRRRRSL